MIEMATNLKDLAQGIGAYVGMADGIEQADYMDRLITSAFASTDRVFNMKTSSYMQGTGELQHMYEFGTAGVYGGDGTGNPNLKHNRLWRTLLTGGGGRKAIKFTFVPAKKPRTSFTAEEGGISNSSFDPTRLKVNRGERYFWSNKAFDVESGRTLVVNTRNRWTTDKNGKKVLSKLFWPNIYSDGRNLDDKAEKRGWSYPTWVSYSPRDFTDRFFSAHFVEWWGLEGGPLMGEAMIRKFNEDVVSFNTELTVKPSAPVPPGAQNLSAEFESSRRVRQKQWTIKAFGMYGEYHESPVIL